MVSLLVVAAFQISAGGNPAPSLKTRKFFIADIYQNGIEKICHMFLMDFCQMKLCIGKTNDSSMRGSCYTWWVFSSRAP